MFHGVCDDRIRSKLGNIPKGELCKSEVNRQKGPFNKNPYLFSTGLFVTEDRV